MKDFAELGASAERVVDAAEGLIQEHGYNGFSYDDISRLMGLKKPGIHHHFPTKAELVAVVTQRYTHRFGERLAEIDRRKPKSSDKLLAYAGLFAETFSRDRRLCVCGMLGAEADDLPQDVAREVNRFFQFNLNWLSAVFAAGREASNLKFHGPAESQAEVFLCALEGSMIVGRGLPKASGPAAVARQLIANLKP